MAKPLERKFPLLIEIDDQSHAEDPQWNENAFQTLLTSNLPTTTVVYYAVDVALRRFERSLEENYWDITADALHDASQYLLTLPITDDLQSYLYEAKCQLLLFASIALLKYHRIRHRSTQEAKMACATICLLLFEQSKNFQIHSNTHEYSSCLHSMRSRFHKRIFFAAQWIPTFSAEQLRLIESNHEKYINLLLEQLFPAKLIRDRLNDFIEYSLLQGDGAAQDAISSGFVFIQRFPRFQTNTLETYSDLIHISLINTLQQVHPNHSRLFIYCLWTLSCMIEADRLSLGVLQNQLNRDHFASSPIDFEQKPLTMESLHLCDLMVFLLLCAQQNIRPSNADSILNPYLLYSSANVCTKTQQQWWLSAIEQSSFTDFPQHLATIRLDDERFNYFPPISVLLQTARILFKSAQKNYEQYSTSMASSYEQYAIQYFQTVKRLMKDDRTPVKVDRPLFYFASSTSTSNEPIQSLIEECEQLARRCDDLKSLPRPESPPVPIHPIEPDDEDEDSFVPVQAEPDQPQFPTTTESLAFITAPSVERRDIDVQTIDPIPSPPIVESPIPSEEAPIPPPLPPLVGMIFSHMNGVNQWINRHCLVNEGIQNDIHAIRDRLERLNRATSQMIYGINRSNSSDPHGDENSFNS